MSYKVQNNVQGTIQNNPLTNSGTNLVVDSTTDAKLNALGAFPFFLSLWNVGTNPNDPGNNMEIVLVTARPSADNYTIVRAQQSTTGVQHNFGDNVALLWTKANSDSKQDVDGSSTYASDTGSTNAYAIAVSYTLTAYTAGLEVTLLPAHSNSGASTINVNSLGNKSIVKNNDQALEADDIVANIPVSLVYDGINFNLIASNSRRNTYVQSTNPAVGNDNTQGFQVGSIWVNTTAGSVWICVSNGTGTASWVLAGGGQHLSQTIYTSSGTYIVPPNVTVIDYYIIGGGGGGGGGGSSGVSGWNAGGGGGGSGGGYYITNQTVTPLSILPVVVGTGGAAAANGTSSSFNGSTATGGLAGANAVTSSSPVPGAGGGGGTPSGQSGVTATANGGNGGNPPYIGNGGNGGIGFQNGFPGVVGGGGGGGGSVFNNAGGGGVGGNGIVIILAHI